jgi:hypothetical protein
MAESELSSHIWRQMKSDENWETSERRKDLSPGKTEENFFLP